MSDRLQSNYSKWGECGTLVILLTGYLLSNPHPFPFSNSAYKAYRLHFKMSTLNWFVFFKCFPSENAKWKLAKINSSAFILGYSPRTPPPPQALESSAMLVIKRNAMSKEREKKEKKEKCRRISQQIKMEFKKSKKKIKTSGGVAMRCH